jgi:TetR/AcrR family fatty acid metabolism transcriptional regulator
VRPFLAFWQNGSEEEHLKKIAFQREGKKTLILKAANQVFVEKGFNGATISQIAQVAHIADGSIYNYFKSKEDILFSIPEERMQEFFSGLHEHLKGIKGAPNKLRKIIWYQLNFYEKNADYSKLLLIELRQHPGFNQSKAYRLIRQYSKVILKVIEEGKNEKTIRKEIDPHMVRDLILGGIEHFAIRGLIMGRIPNLTEATNVICDLLLSGVAEKDRMISLPLEKLMHMKSAGGGLEGGEVSEQVDE